LASYLPALAMVGYTTHLQDFNPAAFHRNPTTEKDNDKPDDFFKTCDRV